MKGRDDTFTYDEKGYVVAVPGHAKPGEALSGKAICNTCGKRMPVCWDVVCARCGRTFCYDCSIAVQNLWVCRGCLS